MSRLLLWSVGGFLFALLMIGCSGVHANSGGGTGTTGGTGGATSQAATISLSATPPSIVKGGSSTLTVSAGNATGVTITGTDGSSFTLPGNGGTQSVSPLATTIYTATAAGAGGNATATATVTVTAAQTAPPPTVSITASSTSVSAGASSTLNISATNATQVMVTGTDGSSYTLAGTGGPQTVTPSGTTTYTATATGAGGTATATVLVTVAAGAAVPTVTISALPTSITAGGSSVLTVAASNATQVTITGSDKSSYTLPGTGGKQSVSLTATTTFTATATGPGGSASGSVTITVTPNPAPTVQISADPASITAGTSSTLTVTSANATAVTITGSDGSSYALTSTDGTQLVSPTTSTTYTATATGPGGTASQVVTVTVTPIPAPTVSISASPTTVVTGNSTTLTVNYTNATQVTITGSDSSSYTLSPPATTQIVSPSSTTIYTVKVMGAGGSATDSTTVTIVATGTVKDVDHVIFMLQENHSFDNYFGMLNPYRAANNWTKGDDGNTYTVDGIDDKLSTIQVPDDQNNNISLFKFTSTCVDDMSSDWLSSYGDVNRYNFQTARPISMNGFVHTASGFATSCSVNKHCSDGTFSDTAGYRSMGYYDQDFLNYYYYMASQFAVSDRWFSPIASKSVPNRIATFTGGTTNGLVKDPGGNDHLPQLNLENIFKELDNSNVSWKIYYTVTEGLCLNDDDCPQTPSKLYPANHFSNLSYSYRYIYENPSGAACTAPTQPSSAVGDSTNSFCIDTNHIAPISQYFTDVANGTLPSFAFIEAGYGHNDEHPGSDQTILNGQAQVAKIVNALMASSAWKDSVFFLSYDEGGGPYDHVPPVPGHSNDFTSANLASSIPDIASIAVNPDPTNPDRTKDTNFPCVPDPNDPTSTSHCDLSGGTNPDPGATLGDAAQAQGFAAQIGFRVPNMIISPFTRRHYVSHIPMDHTAVIKFVENRFIGPSAHLTNRDAAQPNLLDFFDFKNVPWANPPAPPVALDPQGPSKNCNPDNFGQP